MPDVPLQISAVRVQRAKPRQPAGMLRHFAGNEFVDGPHLLRPGCNRLHNKVLNPRFAALRQQRFHRTVTGGRQTVVKFPRIGCGFPGDCIRINMAMGINDLVHGTLLGF